MDDHFHSSLRELRLQLDLMNSRTASILNKPRQQSNMLTRDSSEIDSSSSAMADNMQQIKHIGATVGTLAKNQEDRFQALEHQLDALSNKLGDLALNNPQFTPPESPSDSDSDSASSHSDAASISSQNSTMPHSPQPDKAPATVADIGGYFYPNYVQRGQNDQQFITDASSFVGRVYRTLRTKSITNIEIFLRGSALRWYHLGLRTDGMHLFDMLNGDFDLINFCHSLISLFGVPESLASAINIKTLPLTSSWMRSVIIEDYIFPALEYVRRQEKFYGENSGASAAVSKALTLYNQSSKPCTVSPEIFDCTADAQIQDMFDLQFILTDIRCTELEQKLNRLSSRHCQIATDGAFTVLGTESPKKGSLSSSKVQQDSVPAAISMFNGKASPSTVAGLHDRPKVQSQTSLVEMPGVAQVEVADSVARAVEFYPPAPTAESCPTTPIASYHSSSKHLDSASWTNKVCEEVGIVTATQPEKRTQPMQNDPTSLRAVLAHLAQRTAESKAKNSADQSHLIARDVMPFVGGPVQENSRLTRPASAKSCSFLRESAEIKSILDDIPLIQAPDPTSDDELYSTPTNDDIIPEAGNVHIPEGADRCLTGLTFAFTGQLAYLSREEGEDLVKRYGGKCATTPNKKTSFVVLGAGAGPKKLATIKQYDLRVINENGLFALISRLPALDRPMPEQNKEAERLKNTTEDVSTAAVTPHQVDGSISTATPGYPSQQQTRQQQQVSQVQDSFPLGPHARAFLDGFKVFPPTNIGPNTPEYRNYQSFVKNTLTRMVITQESSVSRFKDAHDQITQLEAARQRVPQTLTTARGIAMMDLQDAKRQIDAMRMQNEQHRFAWCDKSKSSPARKTPVAVLGNDHFRSHSRTTHPATTEQSNNVEMLFYNSQDSARDERVFYDSLEKQFCKDG